MKVAITHYGRFECDTLGLFINDGDTFIVTPKIEKSKQFQTGLTRKKFEFIDVTDLSVVQKAVNVTPTILEKFRDKLTADPEPENDEPEKNEDEVPPEEEKKPEETPPEEEKTEEAPKEEIPDEKAEDKSEEPDPVLPFTEAAGGIPDAKVAIEKETDIEKLKFALEHDSRVTLKPVLEARIKELES